MAQVVLEKRDATPPYKPLENPEQYAAIHMNPADNAENLPASYLQALQRLPPRERLRFWEGRFGSADEGALWTFESIETTRVTGHPDLQRIVVAVDPSGTRGPEDERSDHVGIVVAGLGTDGEAYVLEDLTVKAPPNVWGRIVVAAFHRHDADAIVAETNFGGAVVAEVARRRWMLGCGSTSKRSRRRGARSFAPSRLRCYTDRPRSTTSAAFRCWRTS